MMRRRRSSGGSTTTTTTTDGGMGGGGMMGGACYTYPDSPATPGLTTADIIFNRSIYMNGSMRMDDGRRVFIWGFRESGGGIGGLGNG